MRRCPDRVVFEGALGSTLFAVPVSVVLAVVLAVIAAGVFLPAQACRGILILAVVVAWVIWAGQDFGGIFTGAGTDPNSGPLLALLASPGPRSWPARAAAGAAVCSGGGIVIGPSWLAATFATVMICVAAYCTGRLITARARPRVIERDVDSAHIAEALRWRGCSSRAFACCRPAPGR